MRFQLQSRLGTGDANRSMPFEALRGVAVSDQGHWLLVGDRRVKVYSTAGEPVREWPTARPGWSVTVDPETNVWVGEPGQIEVFSSEGRLLDTWRDESLFGLVTALSVSVDEAFVADVGSRWIHRFDGQRQLLNHIGDRHRKGGFHIPNGVLDFARDSDGTLVVANPGMHRVERYEPGGEQRGFFGRFGQHDPQGFPGCCNPTNLALTPDGDIVVSEKAGPRVKVYDPSGALAAVVAEEDVFDPACANMDLVVRSDGALGVVDTVERSLVVFERVDASADVPAAGAPA